MLAALLLLLIGSASGSSELSCRDTDGSSVDWFVALKKPHSQEFAKVTAQQHQTWQRDPTQSLNSSGPVFQTLQQGLDHAFRQNGTSDTLLIAYNDETPSQSVSYTKGHMKGVVLLRGSSGLWLVHSVPKYPNLQASELHYPHTGIYYGQSFLCVSFKASELDKVARQLWVGHPSIYDWRVSSDLLKRHPALQLLHKGKRANISHSATEIVSAAGISLRHFAKSGSWQQDLYDSFVAPQLKQSLYVETWEHGKQLLDSNCTAHYPVMRITSIASSVFGEDFSSEKDHSKWCVSTSGDSSSVCIGDMNRAKTQFHRGGGTLCISNQQLHQLFAAAVGDYDKCNVEQWDISVLQMLMLWLVVLALVSAVASMAALMVTCLRRRSRRVTYQKL